MPTLQPVEGNLQPPWWRTVLLVVAGIFGCLSSVVYSPAGAVAGTPAASAWEQVGGNLGFLFALGAPVLLIWRARHPLVYVIAAVVMSLALPLGNTLPWITLGALLGRRRGTAVWVMAGLVLLTSAWVAVADARQPAGQSFLRMLVAPPGTAPEQAPEVGAGLALLLAALGWGVAVGFGMLIRGRREAAAARETTRTERATSARLGDEMARQQERERIAREVHDVLGHRLSLLSLHAGALEANAANDERLRASAALVRENASGAMADLRSLLLVLHQPGGQQPDLPLTMLPKVVADAFGAGELLTSSIFVQDADHASPTLSRAVYRIVQELLTNARKHAAGQRVWLTVDGGPTTGVVIDVRNALHGAPLAGAGGSGRGLPGIAERAELLGGTVRYGLDEDGTRFRVRVELPWLGD